MADQELAVWDMLKLARGGEAAREATEVAVKPVGEPSDFSKVITHNPALWRRKASRKAWEGERGSVVFTYSTLRLEPGARLPSPATMGES
jgi:hypothetical protein|tara:strand:+ start:4102 stop:4371 length:270 start_codon:yes stop_codon:yes gene_type:complete